MTNIPFATLLFQGARFDSAQMPLDVLPELAAYRMIVLSVAKAVFQLEHPDRQRVPRGFEASFQLFLQSVESGSAVPIVSRAVVGPTLFGDTFDRARDLVENAISAASSGAALSAELSNEVLARFAAFGKTLRPTERVIVAKPGTRDGAVYDRAVRQRLIQLSHSSYMDDVDLIGVVREADLDSNAFAFRTLAGRRIDVAQSPEFLPTAIRLMSTPDPARIRGLGLFDSNGALQKVISTTDLSVIEEGEDSGCPTPVDDQVRSLGLLDDGWFDAASSRYSPEELEWLRKLLKAVVTAFSIPTPYVYPAPEGFVRAEWSSALAEVVANIDVSERSAELVAVSNGNIESVSELEISFNDGGGEIKFGRFLTDQLVNA